MRCAWIYGTGHLYRDLQPRHYTRQSSLRPAPFSGTRPALHALCRLQAAPALHRPDEHRAQTCAGHTRTRERVRERDVQRATSVAVQSLPVAPVLLVLRRRRGLERGGSDGAVLTWSVCNYNICMHIHMYLYGVHT